MSPESSRSVPSIHTNGLFKRKLLPWCCLIILFPAYDFVLLQFILECFYWFMGSCGEGGGLFIFHEGWGWRPHLATEIFLFDGLLWLADRVRIVAWVHPLDLILCMEYFEKPHPVHSLKEGNLHETWWMAAVDMQLVSHVFFLSFYTRYSPPSLYCVFWPLVQHFWNPFRNCTQCCWMWLGKMGKW